MQLQIPNSCTFVANNNFFGGHVWTIQIEGGDRVTVIANNNLNGTITYQIEGLFHWFTTDVVELEALIAQYAEVGNWEQEK